MRNNRGIKTFHLKILLKKTEVEEYVPKESQVTQKSNSKMATVHPT